MRLRTLLPLIPALLWLGLACDDDVNPTGTSSGSVVGTWILVQEHWVYTDGVNIDSETNDYTAQNSPAVMVIGQSTITRYGYYEAEVDSETALYVCGGNQLIIIGVEQDTFTVSFSGGQMIMASIWVDGNESETVRETYARYTGPVPPTHWGVTGGDIYEPDDQLYEATPIVPGTNQAHTLTSSDVDALVFTAVAGNTYVIETSGSVDTYLTLIGTDGDTILAEDDDDGAEYNARIVWTCTSATAGVVYVEVEGYDEYETGPYTVTMQVQ